eukprot:m.224330 g.224330  ORF g.224330 m.224330 type:complete len:614 (-) comp17033_c1_seq1:174-2015(-)
MMRFALLPLLFALAAALCAAAPVAQVDSTTDNQPLTSDNLYLAKAAYQEFQSLDKKTQDQVKAKIDAFGLRLADADFLHISSDGDLVFEDMFDLSQISIDDDKLADAHERGRRYISNKPPSKYDSNGLPIYHSKPGSKNVLFLDFDGHTVPGDSHWGKHVALPYDPSGNGVKFTSYEQGQISLIWARVAEDYAPFNIDVTTEDFGTQSTTQMRCLITRKKDANGNGLPAENAGGVAVVGIFGKAKLPFYSPAFVYWDNLINGLNDFVAEAASHEIGHNIGLGHHLFTDKQYADAYKGTTKLNSWGPIMGSSYNMAETQWSNGAYTGSTSNQDDYAIIKGQLGLRRDETGQKPSAAKSVKYNGKEILADGIISKRRDKDWWKIELSATGSISVVGTPWYASARAAGNNLDIKLSLRNANGKVIKANNPSGTSTASLTKTGLPAGTYFVEVDGVGDPKGYASDYGSLGQYQLTGTVSAPPKQAKTGGSALTFPSLSCPQNDKYYRNQIKRQAEQIIPGDYAGIVCAREFDWFKINVCKGGRLTTHIDLKSDKTLAPLKLVIRKRNNYQLGATRVEGTSDSLSVTVPRTADYYIGVKGLDRTGAVTYHIDVSISGC